MQNIDLSRLLQKYYPNYNCLTEVSCIHLHRLINTTANIQYYTVHCRYVFQQEAAELHRSSYLSSTTMLKLHPESMKWWQVMTLDGVGLSIANTTYPSLAKASSILRRPHHEIHFDAIAEAEYHPRFQLRYWRTNFYNFELIILRG